MKLQNYQLEHCKFLTCFNGLSFYWNKYPCYSIKPKRGYVLSLCKLINNVHAELSGIPYELPSVFSEFFWELILCTIQPKFYVVSVFPSRLFSSTLLTSSTTTREMFISLIGSASPTGIKMTFLSKSYLSSIDVRPEIN